MVFGWDACQEMLLPVKLTMQSNKMGYDNNSRYVGIIWTSIFLSNLYAYSFAALIKVVFTQVSYLCL